MIIVGARPTHKLLTRFLEATAEKTLAETDVRVRPRRRTGLVVDEILGEAQEERYDLIAIGAH